MSQLYLHSRHIAGILHNEYPMPCRAEWGVLSLSTPQTLGPDSTVC